MTKSDSIAQLAEALSKAQGAIKNALKDSANPYFKSKYADLASVWDACRKELSENGLSVVQVPEMVNGGEEFKIKVNTLLMHSSGEWISGDLVMIPVKDDPQGVGSAITYARRYALSAFVGIAPEDDDGNAASGKPSMANLKNSRSTQAITFSEDSAEPNSGQSGETSGEATAAPSAETKEQLEMSIQYISAGQAANLHKQFRKAVEQYHPAKALESDDRLYAWLKARGYIDKDNNGTASRIPASGWFKIRDEALEYAKTLDALK